MSHYVLSIFDVSAIQEYIFASNRLRENISASFLVEQASGAWFFAALPPPHNLLEDGSVRTTPTIENAECFAEVIYRGGGKLVVLFRGNDEQAALRHAHTTARQLSAQVLFDAPGLMLDVAHEAFAWSAPLGGTDGVYENVQTKLREMRLHRRSMLGSIGMGVTLACRSTGLPAVGWDPDDFGRPVSAIVRAKVTQQLRNDADEHLRQVLGLTAADLQDYTFSRDLDELGRSRGEMSYISLVHADANNIGARFHALAEAYPDPAQNRAFLNHLRNFSYALEASGQQALQHSTRSLLDALAGPLADVKKDLLKDPRSGKRFLPFRPLVFGGDDVTFVCDGRLGLTLAARYLQAFDDATRHFFPPGSILGEPPHACAGVAIVKTHYPFARAYALCEALCDNSKQLVQRLGRDQAALDWYIADTGISAGLEDLRERYYQRADGAMHTRPLPLTGSWPSWPSFQELVDIFTNHPDWRGRHNKVIALYEALGNGSQAAEHFRVAYGVQLLPEVAGITSESHYRQTGWHDQRCVYSDAIEALDFYTALEPAPVPEEVTL